MTCDMNAVLAALDKDECRHVDRIAQITGLDNRGIVKSAGSLIARGLAERREVGCFVLTVEGAAWLGAGKVITSGPARPNPARTKRPAKRTVCDRVWDALRIKIKASTPEILEVVDVDTGQEQGVRRYLHRLHKAGYLLELRRAAGTAPTSNGYKRWMLLRDSGPEAPRARRDGVYDPNSREFHAFAQGGES